jgi:hypothetical protein
MRRGASNIDLIIIGVLVIYGRHYSQGKSDFDAIEAYRDDTFFQRVLSVPVVPASPTLRQRLDANAAQWFDLATNLNAALLGKRWHEVAPEFRSA